MRSHGAYGRICVAGDDRIEYRGVLCVSIGEELATRRDKFTTSRDCNAHRARQKFQHLDDVRVVRRASNFEMERKILVATAAALSLQLNHRRGEALAPRRRANLYS